MRAENTPKLLKAGSRVDQFLTKQFSGSMFTYRQIFGMLVPLILDQFFIIFINMLTTSMISASGQDSVSAVSLVSPITMLVMSLFSAVSAGGTVVVAQYQGRGDGEKTRRAAGQVVFATFLVAVVSSIVLVFFAHPIVNLLFASAEEAVRAKAGDYLVGMAISFIPFSIYQGVFAALRGVGDTKTCLRLTVIINVIHLFASMLFLNVMKLDIIGTALSYNLARVIGGAVAVFLLMHPRGALHIGLRTIFRKDFGVQSAVFRMGIPFAAEQIFLNGGSIIVQTYMVQLGTVSIAANAIGNSVISLFYSAGMAVATLSITLIGQCIGAKKYGEARKYGKKMVLLGTVMILLSAAIIYPLLSLILGLYHPEAETLLVIRQLMFISVIPMPFFWASSTIMPSTLRAAGDASFTSVVSLVTMWVVRVGLGWLFAITLNMGVQGVWICMAIEWAVRSVIFWLRFRGEKWYAKKAIE